MHVFTGFTLLATLVAERTDLNSSSSQRGKSFIKHCDDSKMQDETTWVNLYERLGVDDKVLEAERLQAEKKRNAPIIKSEQVVNEMGNYRGILNSLAMRQGWKVNVSTN